MQFQIFVVSVAFRLHKQSGEAMVSVAARVGLLITILSVSAGVAGAWFRTAQPAGDAARAANVPEAKIDDDNGSAVRHDDASDGVVDLFGNPVSDAVAKYELDSTGDLYELHSPQTELPRLKSPKS
jgi:hypothetical protein